MKILQNCDLCGSAGFLLLYRLKDNKYPVSRYFNLVQCNSCGLLFLNPQPEWSELQEYYPMEYDAWVPLQKRSNDVTIKTWRKLAQAFYLIGLPKKGNYRILDVGCGAGDIVEEMGNRGFVAMGVEPSPTAYAVARSRNLNVIGSTLEEAKFPKNHFDIVTCYDVIEHVPSPMQTLVEMKRITKPRGIIIVKTPNLKSLDHRLLKERFSQLDPPRHLFLMNKSVLSRYGEVVGLDVVRIWYPSLNFEAFKGLYPTLGNIAHVLVLAVTLPLNWLGMGDSIEVWYQKP